MKNGKETKSVDTKASEVAIRDPDWDSFDADSSTDINVLSLPAKFKEKLTGQGFDWRFISAAKFRDTGNLHRGYWKPYKVGPEDGITGLNAEGYIQRQDLILAVRPKRITQTMKQRKAERNARQAGFNKSQAQELRKMAKEAGVSQNTKVYEGYDENE
jgi:hypothetical protein